VQQFKVNWRRLIGILVLLVPAGLGYIAYDTEADFNKKCPGHSVSNIDDTSCYTYRENSAQIRDGFGAMTAFSSLVCLPIGALLVLNRDKDNGEPLG